MTYLDEKIPHMVENVVWNRQNLKLLLPMELGLRTKLVIWKQLALVMEVVLGMEVVLEMYLDIL